MSITLRSYLDSRRTTGTNWNITGLGPSRASVPPDENKNWLGKYAIPDDEYDAFLTLVHDHIFTRGKACSLLEKHKAQSPILIDLDFRYPKGGPLHRRFTDNHVRLFIAAYADAFSRFFGPSAPSLEFYVMTKPGPEVEKDFHKDGIHIVCPSLTTAPEIQYALRGWMLQNNIVQKIFGDTGITNSEQDCFDISVIARNNWFLYGACKPDKAWYKLTDIYFFEVPETYGDPINDSNLYSLDITELTSLELVKRLSLRLHHNEISNIELRTDSAETETEWTQLLQRWGKGTHWKPPAPSVSGVSQRGGGSGASSIGDGWEPESSSVIEGGWTDASAGVIQINGGKISTAELHQVFRLVQECLNPIRRAQAYLDWINLGLLLHNISPTEEACNTWAEFSRRVPGYSGTSDAVYREKWKQLPTELSAQQKGKKALSVGTLHWWAKEDSPLTYKHILEESNMELAIVNDSGTHVSVADLVLKMYQHEFRCCPPKKGTSAAAMEWYQFPPDGGHTWRSLKTWHQLRQRLSTEVRNVYIRANNKVRDRMVAATESSEREHLEEKSKRIHKVEQQLQNASFKDSVMKEITEKFYDEEFLDTLNKDITLVGFSNGVLELRHVGTDGDFHIFFRNGRPDDCVSFQMGRGIVGLEEIPYIPYNPSDPQIEHLEIMDFFAKIYPNEELRKYCLTLFSACLEGTNREQLFYVMAGTGGNGKSKVIDLMTKTFGEYQETLPVTALTRKRADAGNANPELIPIKDKRFVSMVEPEEGEKINTSFMKQLTGGDIMKARGLYKDQDQFVVMARIFMSCNDLPPVSSMDDGTWRRMRVIPHISKFVPAGDPTNPATHIYPRDPLLDVKITKWRAHFAGILVWYYENHYLRGTMKEPECVTVASKQYRETNDSFNSFVSERLVREMGAELRIADLMVIYKDWCKYNPGKKVLQKKEIIERMKSLYGAPIDNKLFVGVRPAEEGEDTSGNTIVLLS